MQVLHWLDCVFSFKAVTREVSLESIAMALTLFGASEDPAADGGGDGGVAPDTSAAQQAAAQLEPGDAEGEG